MKRIAAGFLAAALSLCLFGCASEPTEEKNEPEPSTEVDSKSQENEDNETKIKRDYFTYLDLSGVKDFSRNVTLATTNVILAKQEGDLAKYPAIGEELDTLCDQLLSVKEADVPESMKEFHALNIELANKGKALAAELKAGGYVSETLGAVTTAEIEVTNKGMEFLTTQ